MMDQDNTGNNSLVKDFKPGCLVTHTNSKAWGEYTAGFKVRAMSFEP
jgi:hypothetical protein